jgi:DNA-binding Xre family transcriptional regulator
MNWSKKMLQKILETELRTRNLSIRGAARQIGVAHTTIMRIMDGHQIDLETLKLVCIWLSVDPLVVLGIERLDENSLASKLAILLERNPKLAEVLLNGMNSLENGRVDINDLDEVLAFIAFRLQVSNKKNYD